MGRKVLSTEQIRRIEQKTMEAQNLESWALMEQAAEALCSWVQQACKLDEVVFLVFVGPGNNGGDGLALGRLLYNLDAELAFSLWSEKSSFSPDNKKNQVLARELGITFLKEEELHPWLQGQKKPIIAVDALFGIGFDGEMRPFYRPAVQLLNDRTHIQEVLSIDMPGGVPTEAELSTGLDDVVKATHTLSFEFPKPSFFYRNHEEYLGSWHILDIGFDAQAIADEKAMAMTIELEDLSPFLIPRKRFDYKNSMGHAVICGGSRGKYGALILASRACLRSGTGLLTIVAPRSAFSIAQTSVPEAMYLDNEGEDYLKSSPDFTVYKALGIGPGMDQHEESKTLIESALRSEKPLVLDADALNLIARDHDLLSLLHDQCLLTPHEGEFRRLAGAWTDEKSRLQKLRRFTNKYNCTVLLKGPYSLVASNKSEVFQINTTGNPGMAVGGMGDVLTGILTALLARGYTVEQAASMGAYVHGKAGDYAAIEYGYESLLPSDLIASLSDVWMEVYGE